MSKLAKGACENYHTHNGRSTIRANIYGILYPHQELEVLGGKSSLTI